MSGGIDLLRMAGEALYGDRWQSPIARDLGVSSRTVRHWCGERHACPPDIGGRLLPLVEARGEALRGIADTLRKNGSA